MENLLQRCWGQRRGEWLLRTGTWASQDPSANDYRFAFTWKLKSHTADMLFQPTGLQGPGGIWLPPHMSSSCHANRLKVPRGLRGWNKCEKLQGGLQPPWGWDSHPVTPSSGTYCEKLTVPFALDLWSDPEVRYLSDIPDCFPEPSGAANSMALSFDVVLPWLF